MYVIKKPYLRIDFSFFLVLLSFYSKLFRKPVPKGVGGSKNLKSYYSLKIQNDIIFYLQNEKKSLPSISQHIF